ncbi:MAG: glycosyltransferase [Alphaproteobacteria bacterium]|nr:glycosyltransferase [Alphaproteobacteria bacterium]MCW5739661.1 glycosyltransferase [Alphaproteobacteria bacterium]
MSHVAILIPSGDLLHADFALSLAAVVRCSRSARVIDIMNERSSNLARSRNNLVRRALERRADWALWFDSDMTFPPDTIDRLLSHNEPIVGATYRRRNDPKGSVIGPMLPDQAGVPEDMTAMGYLGMGCVLVSMRVFADVPEPWFNFDETPGRETGEDRWFFERAREAGYRVLCDDWLTTQVGHIGCVTHRVEPLPEATARAA